MSATAARHPFLPAALLACAALCGGCGREDPAPLPPRDDAAEPRDVAPPPVPGLNEDETATDKLLRKPVARDRKPRYSWEEQAPGGALRVICRIPGEYADPPPPKHIDFTGPMAIRNPCTVEPYKVIYNGIAPRGYDIRNELEYYRNWNPPAVETPLRWLAGPRRGEGSLSVNGAAIIVEGVKAGARQELARGSVLISHKHRGRNYLLGRNNHSGFNIAFVPPDEKITFASGDHFPCEIIIERLGTGQALGEPFTVRALPFKREGPYAGWMLRANPGSATQPRPIPAPSPTFREKGVYRMRCLRHPWQVGYAVVVDNPYVGVSGARNPRFPSGNGKTTIDKIPPGTWTVRVWHPLIRPAREKHTVEIIRDETTHLIVEFKPPDELRQAEK
jgi:hypothetical protein